MKRKAHIILLVLLLLCVLSTTAFAIDESEVESAIAASSKEEVAGNVFIWFLCAIGFLNEVFQYRSKEGSCLYDSAADHLRCR